MKRLPLILLISVCACFALASCRRSDGVTHLQLWNQMLPEDRALLESLVKAYEAARESVSVEVIYKETEELRSSFQTASLAGLGPDLIFGPSDQIGPFATMGFVRPLEVSEEVSSINVGELDERLDELVQQGIAKQVENKFVVDVRKLGFEKVLGGGRVTHPLEVTAGKFSEQAKRKLEEAGGKAVEG